MFRWTVHSVPGPVLILSFQDTEGRRQGEESPGMSLLLTAKPYRDTLQTGHGPAQVSQSRGGYILQGGEASFPPPFPLPDNKLWDSGPPWLCCYLKTQVQQLRGQGTSTQPLQKLPGGIALLIACLLSMHEALCSIPAPHKSCMVLHTWNL